MNEIEFQMTWFPLWIAQILRGICIVVAPFCIILCIQLVRKGKLKKHRREIYIGLAALVMSGLYTQVERWNDVATPRLFIVTFGMLYVFKGLLSMRHYKYRVV